MYTFPKKDDADFVMGIWQRVAMDSLKFHLGRESPTLLRSAGGPPQGWPAHRAGSVRPSSTPLDTPRRTPMDFTLWLRKERSGLEVVGPQIRVETGGERRRRKQREDVPRRKQGEDVPRQKQGEDVPRQKHGKTSAHRKGATQGGGGIPAVPCQSGEGNFGNE
jgi:hypothetical protein